MEDGVADEEQVDKTSVSILHTQVCTHVHEYVFLQR